MSFSQRVPLVPPDLMPLEAANRSWMMHQMRLSEYLINNHRLCVGVVVVVVVVVVAAVVVVVVGGGGGGA